MRRLAKWALLGLAVVAVTLLAVFAVARGDGQQRIDSNVVRAGPKLAAGLAAYVGKGDPRPRVQGLWRVVYRPTNHDGKTLHRTWRVLPQCTAGACSFKARSQGLVFDFRFDHAVADYTRNDRGYDNCGPEGTDEVTVANGYLFTRQTSLRITASQVIGGRRYATQMTGRDVGTYRAKKKAVLAGCAYAHPEINRVLAVRLSG